MVFGRLKKVEDLRSVWEREDIHFTPWLAEEENLALLGEELGLDFELIDTEFPVGNYSADIVAKISETEDIAVIENQYGSTDHKHLGQIITYASGLNAKFIIWIVEDVNPEHRQAVDWINENTGDEINIFICKIGLWQIEDSPIAPKFQIISSPNDWTKSVKTSLNTEMNPTKALQRKYWTKVKEEIDKNYSIFSSRKPRGQHWYNLAIGKPSAHISLIMNTQMPGLKVQLHIPNSEELFEYLYNSKEEIESELGYELDWINPENTKSANIVIVKKTDVDNESIWEENIKWHLTRAAEFYNVFSDRVKNFEL
jgi:hypothetical protein